MIRDALRTALAHPLDGTDFPDLGKKYTGKVRDNYTTPDGRRFLVVTDRISAFDRVLGTLPLKGQILNAAATFWFDKTKDVAPNHVIGVPDPNVLEAIECDPLPVEMVMRSYVTGVTSTSLWTHYAAGSRVFCGHALPDGMKKNQRLPKPILTPSTKAEKGGHDVSVSRDEILAMGHVSAKDFDRAAEIAAALFAVGQQHAESRGLILVDTKYELGKRKDGEIVVIDEIHTPDSSRYWKTATYADRFAAGEEPESFDKEYVRRWLAAEGFDGDGPIPTIPDEVKIEASARYVEALETITGTPFVPNLEEPIARMRRNLGLRLRKRRPHADNLGGKVDSQTVGRRTSRQSHRNLAKSAGFRRSWFGSPRGGYPVSMTLLAVDDSVTMRKVLEITFSGDDYRLVVADSADAALKLARSDKPQIALVDVTLPEMDGYAVCRALKQDLPGVAVLILSSKQQPYDTGRGGSAGADDFMDKPFDTQQMLDKVKKLAATRSTAPTVTEQAPATAKPAGLDPKPGGTLPGAGQPPRVPSPPAAAGSGPVRPAAPIAKPQPINVPSPTPTPASGVTRPATPAAPPVAPVAAKPAPIPSPAPPPVAPAPPPAVSAVAAAATDSLAAKVEGLGLTKAQADAVLALSRELVERVVWEVVPVLAETLIKEEIKRLTREG
jgi:phosphoribosylaminoimidazole-succinocarboxamide synthase